MNNLPFEHILVHIFINLWKLLTIAYIHVKFKTKRLSIVTLFFHFDHHHYLFQCNQGEIQICIHVHCVRS